MLGCIGFILLIIGAGGADSNLAASAVMMFSGLALCLIESRKEETAHRRPKH